MRSYLRIKIYHRYIDIHLAMAYYRLIERRWFVGASPDAVRLAGAVKAEMPWFAFVELRLPESSSPWTKAELY